MSVWNIYKNTKWALKITSATFLNEDATLNISDFNNNNN